MKKIIFATSNENKLKEIKSILKDLNLDIISMKDAGIFIDVEETGMTFEENAVMKAKAISKFTDAIVLSDDSGLEVDYINKEPGIYSARYAGTDTPYTIKNQLILDRLKGVKKKERTARFVCVIAAVLPNGEILTTRGTMEGYIAEKASGEQGFGYDPIFFLEEYKCTSAELTMAQKNELSHRGKALRAMKIKLSLYLEK